MIIEDLKIPIYSNGTEVYVIRSDGNAVPNVTSMNDHRLENLPIRDVNIFTGQDAFRPEGTRLELIMLYS